LGKHIEESVGVGRGGCEGGYLPLKLTPEELKITHDVKIGTLAPPSPSFVSFLSSFSTRPPPSLPPRPPIYYSLIK